MLSTRSADPRHVAYKATAFGEFHRVLRPGGRLSLFEPINRSSKIFDGYDFGAVAELAAKVRNLYEAIQPADSDPMRNFDERDLVSLAERAGFEQITLELTTDVRPAPLVPFRAIANIAANPRVPTLAEAMGQVLTAEEVDRMTAYLQSLVEQGHGTRRLAVSYLSATRR
jgi:hypothetical protein